MNLAALGLAIGSATSYRREEGIESLWICYKRSRARPYLARRSEPVTASVSAGQRVHQRGRFGNAPRAHFQHGRLTTTQACGSTAREVRSHWIRTSNYPPRRPHERERWMTTCAWFPSWTDPTARWNSSVLFTCRRRSGRRWLRWRGHLVKQSSRWTRRGGMVLHEGDGAITAFRPRAGAFGASSILSRQSGLCQADLESGVECYRVPANWGRSPRPPRRACRPPHPPCERPPAGAPSSRPARRNFSAALTAKRRSVRYRSGERLVRL
jgi:hypothetical protein